MTNPTTYQLVGATDWVGGQYVWAWTDDAQTASVTYPNQVTTAYDYGAAGQTTAILAADPTGADLLGLVYTYDDAGQMLAQTATRSATGRSPPAVGSTTTSAYAFDPLGRLDRVTGTGAGSFGWDAAGRLTATSDGRSLLYDAAGQVTSVIDPLANTTTTLGYDQRGNRTGRQVTSLAGSASTTMGWDAADRLTSLTTPGTTYQYTYGATGLRTSTTATSGGTSTTERYVWDTARPVPTLLADGTHGYVYGPGDTPVAQVDLSDDTAVYLHHDLIGSVRTATDADGKVLCDTDYDPYGRATSSVSCAATTSFGYAGQYTDPTGLLYLRHRYYDPATAQFLSVDPLVDTTFDPYGYTGGNPLQQTDPLGLDWLSWTDPWIRPVSNFSAGFGDNVTFGLTRKARQAIDVDSVVDTCSTSYAWGGYTGTAASIALPGGGGAGAVVTTVKTVKAVKAAKQVDVAVDTVNTASKSGALVRYDAEAASRTLLGQTGTGYATTPGGRTVSAHAAGRIVNGGGGRPPTTLSRVDDILDNPTSLKYDPTRDTVRVGQGHSWVVVGGSGSQQHIVTVMIPK